MPAVAATADEPDRPLPDSFAEHPTLVKIRELSR